MGWPCSNKTLLTDADNGLDLAHRCKLQEFIEKMEQINCMGGIILPCISNHHDVAGGKEDEAATVFHISAIDQMDEMFQIDLRINRS